MKSKPNGSKENVTRRQHHVWRAYLDAWATGSQVACLVEGRVFETNTINVAVERDFYKLPNLTDDDIKFIRSLMANVHPSAKKVIENFILQFSLPGRVLAIPEIAINVDLRVQAEKLVITTEEEYHEAFEGHIAPIFEAIRRKDLSFYEDPLLCGQFCHFLCLQNLRTKGVQERYFAMAEENGYGEMAKRTWPVLRQIMAVNAGSSFIPERKTRPLILIENETEIPFITGDQPVVNLLGSSYRDAPKLVAFYYPVSPRLAVILDEVSERTDYVPGRVSLDQVRALNGRIQSAAHKQIFGNTREVLESLSPPPEE